MPIQLYVILFQGRLYRPKRIKLAPFLQRLLLISKLDFVLFTIFLYVYFASILLSKLFFCIEKYLCISL